MSNSDNPFASSQGLSGGGSQVNVSFGDGNSNQPTPAPVKDITTAEFMTEVVDASMNMPVVVDFWAPWCQPCKQLGPLIEKVAASFAGRVKLVKMDIEQHPQIAEQMRIQSIPAVVAFVEGKPADAFMGNQPESQIRAFFDKLAGGEVEDPGIAQALEEAEKLASEGSASGAANLFAAVLQQDPANLRALAGMGRLYIDQGNLDAVRGLIDGLQDELADKPEIVSLRSALELAEQAETLGDLQPLADKVATSPADHQARFDYALALNAAGKREEAADELLEIMQRERNWNEEAARLQLLQFFEAWGNTDPATLSARRRLSSLLFS